MPKYTCKECGVEGYGCILYALKACQSCGARIHREDVQENWSWPGHPSSINPSSDLNQNERTERNKLLQFER